MQEMAGTILLFVEGDGVTPGLAGLFSFCFGDPLVRGILPFIFPTFSGIMQNMCLRC